VSYVCSCCGREHPGEPYSFAADSPEPYANMTAEQRANHAEIASDQCVIDEEQFYIRGCIELPIQGTDQIFIWGVWARIFEKDFIEIADHWETEGREHTTGPYKGRLANDISVYPDTLNLLLEIHVRPVGTRPLFVAEHSDHLLAVEQRIGMRQSKAAEHSCVVSPLSAHDLPIM
jgi:hypothetical protein